MEIPNLLEKLSSKLLFERSKERSCRDSILERDEQRDDVSTEEILLFLKKMKEIRTKVS